MSRLVTERLVAVAQAVRAAPHGGKEALYQAACAELQLSRATLLRKIKETVMTAPRKRRSDAGTTALPEAEAQLISAWIMESVRKNAKRILHYDTAIEQLRAEGKIRAEAVDEATGEIRPLSTTTIIRALRSYGLHPDQVSVPAPAMSLASEHPNHVWQIDSSLCVLYKMPRHAGGRIEALDAAEMYKNKLEHYRKVEHLLVQRYAITDHASGTIYVHYLLGGESVRNLLDAFIAATQARAGYPFHGIPRLVMLDPGSANTAAPLKNLGAHLGMRIQVNKPKNPRAKGQVEQAHNLIECEFESGLNKLPAPITCVEELNAHAHRWMHWWNGTKQHSRHNETRYGVWQRITAAQLVLAPAAETLRACAHAEPIRRVVSDLLQVSFEGRVFDLSAMPGVQNRAPVMVCKSAWREDVLQVQMHDAEGREVMYQAPQVIVNEFGFAVGALKIGEQYKRHADSPAQTARKALEQLATGTNSLSEAEAARKAKAVPFGGEINPYKQAEQYQPPTWLPKRGQQHELAARTEFPPLSIVEFAKSMGREWQGSFAAVVQQRYPDGKIPAAEADALKARLLRGEQAPLSVVAGGMK
jgi:hypothetical protein